MRERHSGHDFGGMRGVMVDISEVVDVSGLVNFHILGHWSVDNVCLLSHFLRIFVQDNFDILTG